jgi:hypothetical protein
VILVVGATGILAPACASLVARGGAVLAVARTADDLDRLHADTLGAGGELSTLAADATSDGFVGRLEALPLTGGLVYAPATVGGATDRLAERLGRRLVEVVTSSYADPDSATYDDRWAGGELRPAGHTRVVLGWALDENTADRSGPQSRWHSPDEVSAAAVEALTTGRDRVLGLVAPWETRP